MPRDTCRVAASGVPSAEREEQVDAGRPVVAAMHVARPVSLIGAPLVTVVIPVPVPVMIVFATVTMPVSAVVLSARMTAAMSLAPMPVVAVFGMTAVAPVVDRVDKRLFGPVRAAALAVHRLREARCQHHDRGKRSDHQYLQWSPGHVSFSPVQRMRRLLAPLTGKTVRVRESVGRRSGLVRVSREREQLATAPRTALPPRPGLAAEPVRIAAGGCTGACVCSP